MTACSPSSFILLIRPSHTNFDDKDENPTLASLTIFPQCAPFFWQRSSLVICISVYVPASMLCTALSPAWPSYWCLCCGGHLERCPAAAHERCPYPSSPYSSAWRGCQPRLPSLPGWAMVSNCQCLCTSSAEGDTVFRRAAKLAHVFIFNKWQTVTLTRVSRLPKSRLWSVYANKLVALTGFLAKEIRFLKKKKKDRICSSVWLLARNFARWHNQNLTWSLIQAWATVLSGCAHSCDRTDCPAFRGPLCGLIFEVHEQS